MQNLVSKNVKSLALGEKSPLTISNDNSLLVQFKHAPMQEMVSRKNVFTIQTDTTTPPNVGGGQVRPRLGILNPRNSGVNFSIMTGRIGYTPGGVYSTTVGTYGAWFIKNFPFRATGGQSSPTKTGNQTLANNFINSLTNLSGLPSKAWLWDLSNIPDNDQTPVAIRSFYSGGTVGTFNTTITNLYSPYIQDDVNGELVVPPGAMIGLFFAVGNSTTTNMWFSMTWEEVPI